MVSETHITLWQGDWLRGTCSNQWVRIIVLNGYWRFMFTSSLDEYIESYRNRNSNLTSKNMNQEAGTQESCMIFRVFFLNLQYAGLVPLETWLASTGSSPWRWRRPLLVHPGGRYLGETWHRKSMNIWRREHSKKSWLNLERTFAEHLFWPSTSIIAALKKVEPDSALF